MKSYDKLSKELAMGEGKYLDTMLSLAGATEVSEKKRIRTEFGRLVAQPDYTSMNRKEKVEKLYNIVFQGV
ncbi:hypothetical protein NNO_1320 [Hydrogenimonas sp.]|nr:hypothetical protein NNO_1320 [Hydrogenimonas sp.]